MPRGNGNTEVDQILDLADRAQRMSAELTRLGVSLAQGVRVGGTTQNSSPATNDGTRRSTASDKRRRATDAAQQKRQMSEAHRKAISEGLKRRRQQASSGQLEPATRGGKTRA